jgi:hypothetical protein
MVRLADNVHHAQGICAELTDPGDVWFPMRVCGSGDLLLEPETAIELTRRLGLLDDVVRAAATGG